mmetsp:Transcript_1839/g.2419  ORF Transcript_1839/g.2419 Transcript_1839/m.2419 type:complete len:1647 (+) Transcript_1839:1603-6543(+)
MPSSGLVSSSKSSSSSPSSSTSLLNKNPSFHLGRRDCFVGDKNGIIDMSFIQSLESDPLKTPRFDIDNENSNNRNHVISFEQEIVDRYQEALGTLFPDERIKLVDLKKDVMKQNATSEAEKLELQREFGYDGGEEARGEIPKELLSNGLDVITSTGKLRRDWDRIGQKNKANEKANKDTKNSLPSSLTSSMTSTTNIQTNKNNQTSSTAATDGNGTGGGKNGNNDFFDDNDEDDNEKNKDGRHSHNKTLSIITKPDELSYTYGNFGVSEKESEGHMTRESKLPIEISDHSINDFNPSISMIGDDPPPVNDVEALILEEMSAEEKIARRLKSTDGFLDLNDKQIDLFDEADYIRKEKPVVATSPSNNRRQRRGRLTRVSPTPKKIIPSSSPSSSSTTEVKTPSAPIKKEVSIDSSKQTNKTSNIIQSETSLFSLKTTDSETTKKSMNHMNEIEPGVSEILLEGKVEWNVKSKRNRDKDYDEIDIGSLGNDGEIFNLLHNNENDGQSRLKLYSNEILLKKQLFDEKEKRRQKEYDKKHPEEVLLRLQKQKEEEEAEAAIKAAKEKEEKDKEMNDNNDVSNDPQKDNKSNDKIVNPFLNDPIGRLGITCEGSSLLTKKSKSNLKNTTNNIESIENNGENVDMVPSSSHLNPKLMVLTPEQEKNLPHMSDDEFVQWMNEFVAASMIKVDKDKELVEAMVLKQVAKRKALTGSIIHGLSGLGGISITPTVGSATNHTMASTVAAINSNDNDYGYHHQHQFEEGQLSSSGKQYNQHSMLSTSITHQTIASDILKGIGTPSSPITLGVAGSTPFASRPESRGALPEIQFGRGTGVKIVRSEDGGYSYDYFEPEGSNSNGGNSNVMERSRTNTNSSCFDEDQSSIKGGGGSAGGGGKIRKSWSSPAMNQWNHKDQNTKELMLSSSPRSFIPRNFELKGEAFKLPDINDVKAATLSWSNNVPSLVAGMTNQDKEKAWTDFQSLDMSDVVKLAYEELANASDPNSKPTFLTTTLSNHHHLDSMTEPTSTSTTSLVESTSSSDQNNMKDSPRLILPSIKGYVQTKVELEKEEEDVEEEEEDKNVDLEVKEEKEEESNIELMIVNGENQNSLSLKPKIDKDIIQEVHEEAGLLVSFDNHPLTESVMHESTTSNGQNTTIGYDEVEIEEEDDDGDEEENEELIAQALRSIVSDLHGGENSFWKPESISHQQHHLPPASTSKKDMKKIKTRHMMSSTLPSHSSHSGKIAKTLKTSHSMFALTQPSHSMMEQEHVATASSPQMIEGNPIHIGGVRRINQARVSRNTATTLLRSKRTLPISKTNTQGHRQNVSSSTHKNNMSGRNKTQRNSSSGGVNQWQSTQQTPSSSSTSTTSITTATTIQPPLKKKVKNIFPPLSATTIYPNGEGGNHDLFIDLSLNSVGWQGLCILSLATEKRQQMNLPPFALDLDANSKLAEVMNSVTHGFGLILCFIGSVLLYQKGKEGRHQVSLMVYSVSLCALYFASTLYHSLYMLPPRVKEIFHFMDKAGIYVLIAGTYTPFLVILFPDKPMWSKHLLAFVWAVSLIGITVAAIMKPCRMKARISLTLYLALGWTAVLVVEDARSALPNGAISLFFAGGAAYTGGVPLFVRNRNLDHAIWHLFVLAGSAFHWCCIYFHLAEMP